ncbi:MAG: GGDEF domain-containing phosphodiesterase [Erysipelotrichaceae bacterium]
MKQTPNSKLFKHYKKIISMLIIVFVIVSLYCIKVSDTATNKVNQVAISNTAVNKLTLEKKMNQTIEEIKLILDKYSTLSNEQIQIEFNKLIKSNEYITNINFNDNIVNKDEPTYMLKYNGEIIYYTVDYSKELSKLNSNENSFSMIVDSDNNLLSLSTNTKEDVKDKLIANSKLPFKIDSSNIEFNNTDYHITSTHLLNDNYYYIEAIDSSILLEDINFIRYISIGVVISMSILFSAIITYLFTMIHRMKKEISDLEFIDPVTCGDNIIKFNIDADKIIKNNDKNYVCAVLDIEKFKMINDLLGYNEGDNILRVVSNTLDETLEENEVYARFSGDNFYILMEYKDNDVLEYKLNKIIKLIQSSYTKYALKIDVGIAILERSDNKRDINVMRDHAKLAQRSKKTDLRAPYKYYNDEMRSKMIEDDRLSNDMLNAIKNNEFEVYIQPKYNYKTNKVVGGEALIRWNHPELGLLYPVSFINLFEKNGFIRELDNFVLETVMSQCRLWQQANLPVIPISVNQSKVCLRDANYLDIMEALVEENNIAANWIELEVTESTVFDNLELLQNIILKLHSIGFVVAMDDFGSGYSSLNLLKDINFDVLKLDRVFFVNQSNIERSTIILKNIIKMARELKMEIVAEGVESQSQIDFLHQIECYIVQGDIYSKAIKITEFEKLAFGEQRTFYVI